MKDEIVLGNAFIKNAKSYYVYKLNVQSLYYLCCYYSKQVSTFNNLGLDTSRTFIRHTVENHQASSIFTS